MILLGLKLEVSEVEVTSEVINALIKEEELTNALIKEEELTNVVVKDIRKSKK
jgi:hypothetical protein